MWQVQSYGSRSHLHFKALYEDDSYGMLQAKYVSRKLNNGDFDYWLVIEVSSDSSPSNVYGGREYTDYYVSVSAVAPSQVSDKEKRFALESCGWKDASDMTDLDWVYVLSGYGIRATIYQGQGHNIRQLLKDARLHACVMGDGMFGFAMDAPQNALGATGWDLVQGNVYGQFLSKGD